MQNVQAITNQPYPNRIQLVITPPFLGPFTQAGPLGTFNPVRDLSIYADGSLQTVQSSNFDTNNNRYLIYLTHAINPQSFVQVIHHVPNPPFLDWNLNELGGFALVATYMQGGDTSTARMALSVTPVNAILGTASAFLAWITTGVAQVMITGSFGSPPFTTGFLGANGTYVLPLPNAVGVYTLTMTGYNSYGSPIVGLTATTTITVATGDYLMQDDGVSRFVIDGGGYILITAGTTEDFFVSEDGTSHFLLEDGSGVFILET
jgi:hypothetical protein